MEWSALIPVGGVVLGSILGSAGTLLSQKLSDSRTLRRDRLLAQEEATERLKVERLATQRQAVIELQEALEHVMIANHGGPHARLSSDAQAVLATGPSTRTWALVARLEHREVAQQAQEWLTTAYANEGDRREALHIVQEALGRHLQLLYAE